MNSWLAFVLGMVLGCNLGVLAICLLAAGRRGERPHTPAGGACAQGFAQWAAQARGGRGETQEAK